MKAKTKSKLIDIILPVADYLARRGIYTPNDAELTELIKTVSGYRNAMWRAVVALYNYKIDEFEFVSRIADLIADQMRRAYNEGLRATGFDPQEMTPQMIVELADIIASEENYVLDFASAILDNRDKDPRPPSTMFKPRINVWANRYKDAVNRATLTAGLIKNILLEWVLGETEHCETCLTLDGTVATAKQWRGSGYHPQRPPNSLLVCGGWNCACELSPTDKDATIPENGEIIMAIKGGVGSGFFNHAGRPGLVGGSSRGEVTVSDITEFVNNFIENHIGNHNFVQYDYYGLRFGNRVYKIGDKVHASRHNADRIDEREFPEFGSDEYNNFILLNGTSAWGIDGVNGNWIYGYTDWENKDSDEVFDFTDHIYIIAGDIDNTHFDADENEIVIGDAIVVAIIK